MATVKEKKRQFYSNALPAGMEMEFGKQFDSNYEAEGPPVPWLWNSHS